MGAGGRVASTSNASTRPARVWVAEGPRSAEEIQRLEEERRLTLKMRDFRTMDDLHDGVDGFSDHYNNNGSNSYFSRYRDSGSDLVLLNGGSCYELLSEFDRLGGYGYELDETRTRVVNCGAPQLTRTVQVAEAKNRVMARKAGRDGIHAIVLQRNTWFLLHSVAAKVSEEDERRNREIAAFIRALGEQQQQQQNVNLQQQKVTNSSDGDDLLAAIPRTMASVDACDEDFDDENDDGLVVDPQNIVAQQPQPIAAPVLLPTGSAASNMDVDVQQKQQQQQQQQNEQEQQATIVASGAIGSRPEQTWPAPSASISNGNSGSHRSASLPVVLLPIGTAGISDKQNSNNSYVARQPIRRSRSTGTIFSCGGSSISFGDSSSSDNSLAKKARCTPECIMA